MTTDVEQLWGSFIAGFCKVEFLCHGGEPNWLGWIVIVWAAVVVGALFLGIFFPLLGGAIEVVVDGLEKLFKPRRKD